MIRADEIKCLTPEMVAELTPQAVLEYSASRREFANEQVYAVWDDDKLLMIVGINKRGMLAPAEIWLLLGKAYGPKYAKLSKRVVQGWAWKYGGLYTVVNIDLSLACRFARFIGFKPKNSFHSHAGETYQLYEVHP